MEVLSRSIHGQTSRRAFDVHVDTVNVSLNDFSHGEIFLWPEVRGIWMDLAGPG